MTISTDGNLTPADSPDPCWVCGGPVSAGHEYRDRHDGCAGKIADTGGGAEGSQ